MEGTLAQILAWDRAGPVAILFFVVICLAWLTRWLLRQLLISQNRQIDRANDLTDKLGDEIGETLDQILTALRARDDRKEDR